MKPKILKPVGICIGLLLATTFSCSEEDNLVEVEEQQSVNTEALSARTKGKQISGCNNPKGYQIYTVGELPGLSDSNDYVNKKAINGTDVDIIRDLDDRTCAYNYSQERRSNVNYGKYRIRAGSNKYDTKLQPRIERATKVVKRKKGNFVSVEGFVRIRRVGGRPSGNNYSQTDMRDLRGTYIMQAKGKHSNKTIGSDDPAIALLVAKPASNGNFNIYREQITKRGGSGTSGRRLVKLKTVPGDRRVKIKMTNGWSTDTGQYVRVTISGTTFSWNVPNTKIEVSKDVFKFQVGQDAKIRFGAYRCHSGEADIWWSDIKHDFKG